MSTNVGGQAGMGGLGWSLKRSAAVGHRVHDMDRDYFTRPGCSEPIQPHLECSRMGYPPVTYSGGQNTSSPPALLVSDFR